jgi:hypothetical protein
MKAGFLHVSAKPPLTHNEVSDLGVSIDASKELERFNVRADLDFMKNQTKRESSSDGETVRNPAGDHRRLSNPATHLSNLQRKGIRAIASPLKPLIGIFYNARDLFAGQATAHVSLDAPTRHVLHKAIDLDVRDLHQKVRHPSPECTKLGE